MTSTLREHAKMRMEFIRERERRATTDIGSTITTELIPELQVSRHLRRRILTITYNMEGYNMWLNGLVVSALVIRTQGPRFDSWSRHYSIG